MRLALLATALVLSLPGQSFAACAIGKPLLSCPIGKKQLEVCLSSDSVSYSFGAKGKPELTIVAPITEADYVPWSGVGSIIWDAIHFYNKGITYEVWTSTERNPDAVEGIQGGINVMKGEDIQAELRCKSGTVKSDLYAVFEAKEAAGQCWNFDKQAWDTSCPAQ